METVKMIKLTTDHVISIEFIDPEITNNVLAEIIEEVGVTEGILVDGWALVPTTDIGVAINLAKEFYANDWGQDEEYDLGDFSCKLVALCDYLSQ